MESNVAKRGCRWARQYGPRKKLGSHMPLRYRDLLTRLLSSQAPLKPSATQRCPTKPNVGLGIEDHIEDHKERWCPRATPKDTKQEGEDTWAAPDV
jgi:hypothetical protein